MIDVLTFIMAIIVIMISIPQAVGFVLFTVSLFLKDDIDDDNIDQKQ